jgi:hypothetical protein
MLETFRGELIFQGMEFVEKVKSCVPPSVAIL